MKRSATATLLLIALFALSAQGLADNFEGRIITVDNKIIESPLIITKETLPVRFLENNVETAVKMKDVMRVVIVDPRFHSDIDAMIFLRDGRKFSVNFNADNFSGDSISRFLYKQPDPISGNLVTQGRRHPFLSSSRV